MPLFEERKKAFKTWTQHQGQALTSGFDYAIYLTSLFTSRLHYVALAPVTFYLFYLLSDPTDLQNVYQFAFLCWFVLIGTDLDYVGTIRVAAFWVSPAFIVDQMYKETISIINFYTTEGVSDILQQKLSRIFALLFIMIYCFMLTFKDKTSFSGKLTKKIIIRLNKFKEKKIAIEKSLQKNLYMILELGVYKILRVVAIAFTVYSAVATVNIFNGLLVFFSFFILYDTSRDKKYWPILQYLVVFLIMEVYFSRLVNGYITALNPEIVSFFGLYAGSVPICKRRVSDYRCGPNQKLPGCIHLHISHRLREAIHRASKDRSRTFKAVRTFSTGPGHP